MISNTLPFSFSFISDHPNKQPKLELFMYPFNPCGYTEHIFTFSFKLISSPGTYWALYEWKRWKMYCDEKESWKVWSMEECHARTQAALWRMRTVGSWGEWGQELGRKTSWKLDMHPSTSEHKEHWLRSGLESWTHHLRLIITWHFWVGTVAVRAIIPKAASTVPGREKALNKCSSFALLPKSACPSMPPPASAPAPACHCRLTLT